MKKTLLLVISLMLCLSSCVDKQKRFREITDEMDLNTSALLFTTMSFLSKIPTDDDYATKEMFGTLKENGVCGRVYSLIEKDEKLFDEAADLDIDIEKLNHLKGINDCCKNVWKYV